MAEPMNKLKQQLAYENSRLLVHRRNLDRARRGVEVAQAHLSEMLKLTLETRRDISKIEQDIANHPETKKGT